VLLAGTDRSLSHTGVSQTWTRMRGDTSRCGPRGSGRIRVGLHVMAGPPLQGRLAPNAARPAGLGGAGRAEVEDAARAAVAAGGLQVLGGKASHLHSGPTATTPGLQV
jgi:hypothetical protein